MNDHKPTYWEFVERLSSGSVAGGGDGSGGTAQRPRPVAAASVCSSLPPEGNTGGKLTGSVSVDWLNVTFPATAREAIRNRVSETLGQPEAQARGALFLEESIRWEDGGLLAWSESKSYCCLSLNGDSCARFEPAVVKDFIRWSVEDMGGKVTRIDLAFDDPTMKLFRMDDVHDAAQSGDFAGFKSVTPIRKLSKTPEGMSVTGDSVTFGLRGKLGGGRQVCIYDKQLESSGRLNTLRIEARFFKEHASQVGEILASSLTQDSFEGKIRTHIGGAIDFIDRAGSHGHRDRMQRLQWWTRVLDVLGKAAVTVRKVIPPLQRTMEHFRFICPKSFATARETIDRQGMNGRRVMHDLLDLILADGQRKVDRDGYRPGARDLGLDVPMLLATA